MNDDTIQSLLPTNTLAPFDVVESNPITPLAQRSMFWRPSYLDQSAWLEHIPFAFWLVEAHHPRVLVELGAHQGVAYFAFCQGVNRLGLNTRCFSVDTWKDSEQAFDKLSAHNDAQYSGFSRLVRSTVDDARENFSDGSIDLLHMDELHNYESIKHTFDSWLPKLSNTAVVILHGTNVRERHSGILRFFEELKERYPWFEFSHGQGLGIVGVGQEQNKIVSRLFDMRTIDTSTQVIREVFSRLGRACTDSLESITHQNKASELTRLIENQKQLCEELKISLGETKKDLDSRKREAVEVKAKLQNQIEQHATERGQLNERVNLLQETRLELKEEVVNLQAKLETAFVRLAEKGQELTRLALGSADFQRQIDSFGEQIKDRDRKSAEKDRALNEAKVNTEQVNRALAQKEQAIQEARTESDQSVQTLAEQQQVIAKYQDHAQALSDQKHSLEKELQTWTVAATRLEAANQTLQGERQVGAQKLEERFQELALLTQQLREREGQVQAQTVAAAAREQRLEHLSSDLAAAGREATAQSERVAALEAANQTLQGERQVGAQKLDERFKELAMLTKILVARDRSLMDKNQEIGIMKQSFSWRVTAPVRVLARTFKKMKKGPGSIDRQLSLIAQSGLFEPAWYLAQYPDVAGIGMNPIEHYIRNGAAEGRDPGPGFNTTWYVNAYKDVANDGRNPLVHYIKFGKREGRQPMPKQEGH